MPDVTMCRNYKCYWRALCYRYLAKPGFGQSWIEWPSKRLSVHALSPPACYLQAKYPDKLRSLAEADAANGRVK